ncbi:LysE family translocator [Pelagibacterium sp. 26DY04]|uniref:LysE family translocator n=1 Tax=Pelagibacterium sp. 26DY04 TaxID=2967130 RepID=UPI0028165766|nr:LysE family translocator [Pelagibacterium sp. 26DY04]WMT86606.1 LysE family translocator [Pelagibacterium sp. 26DY04]
MIEIYGITLVAIIIAQITPGPNLLAVAGMALSQGRAAALLVTLGVATAIFIWVSAMAAGLGAVLSIYPALITVMKFLGGGYLCFLALKAFRAALRGESPTLKANRRRLSPLGAWRTGLLVNLTNPKSALMWGAVTTFMLGSGLSALQVLAFAPVGFMTALAVYGGYSLLFSTGVARSIYSRFVKGAETLFGLAFGAVGGGLLVSGVRDLSR